jgi:hypothetical protein
MLTKEERRNKHLKKDIGWTEGAMLSMDEYAAQKSIEFAEWLSGEGYQQYDGKDRWVAPHNSNDVYETPQLYKMFLKTITHVK